MTISEYLQNKSNLTKIRKYVPKFANEYFNTDEIHSEVMYVAYLKFSKFDVKL